MVFSAEAFFTRGSNETAAFRTFATLESALRHALGAHGVRLSKRLRA